jgi:hypothetical protein
MNYNVCPCAICEAPINYSSLRESVYWAPKEGFTSFWSNFWGGTRGWQGYPEERMEFAHRRCWRTASATTLLKTLNPAP